MEKCLPQRGLQEAEKGLRTTLFKYTAKQSHLFYFGRILSSYPIWLHTGFFELTRSI